MESSESIPVHKKHWGKLQNAAGMLWLMQKLSKGLSFMGVEGTLGQLEEHGNSLWKQGCSAESPRKPIKCSEVALKENRASKGGWRGMDWRCNLLFSDLDGRNTLGLSLWSILSGP